MNKVQEIIAIDKMVKALDKSIAHWRIMVKYNEALEPDAYRNDHVMASVTQNKPTADDCALCVAYFNESCYLEHNEHPCQDCPLYKTKYEWNCHHYASPYYRTHNVDHAGTFVQAGIRMIGALRIARGKVMRGEVVM